MPFDRELMRTLVMGGVTLATALRIAAGTLPRPPEAWLEKARRGDFAPQQTTKSGHYPPVLRASSTSKGQRGHKN